MEPLRASSKQRDRTVRSLGVAYQQGLLSTGTLELRVGHALSVRTTRELRRLLADLKNRARLRLAVSDVIHGWTEPLPEPAALRLPDDRTRLTIGRLASCDVVLTDPTVSRCHASVRREGGRWILYDLGSSNGTWLNGRRASRVEVVPGDELRFGAHVARLG